jgi:hypothetical protein
MTGSDADDLRPGGHPARHASAGPGPGPGPGQRGLTQVRFVEGDLQEPAPGGPFDAIVERLVLMWAPDPAALLRRHHIKDIIPACSKDLGIKAR